MTIEQFKEWLDFEIRASQNAMNTARGGDVHYFNGWLKCASSLKAKFMTIDFSTEQTETSFTDGLD
jgi:hypothetical protein